MHLCLLKVVQITWCAHPATNFTQTIWSSSFQFWELKLLVCQYVYLYDTHVDSGLCANMHIQYTLRETVLQVSWAPSSAETNGRLLSGLLAVYSTTVRYVCGCRDRYNSTDRAKPAVPRESPHHTLVCQAIASIIQADHNRNKAPLLYVETDDTGRGWEMQETEQKTDGSFDHIPFDSVELTLKNWNN